MSPSKPPPLTRAKILVQRTYPGALLLIATLWAAGVFLSSMLEHTDGQYGAPIDDAYIYFNYARHMAEGSFFEFNAGDGASTGATSVLWTPILALGYLVGFRGDAIVLWAFGLNTVFLFGYGYALYRLALLLFQSRALATLIALAVMLDGRVLWGFYSSMELGLYCFALVSAVYWLARYQREAKPRHLTWLLVATCAVMLVRPEGQFLGAFLLLVFLASKLLAARRAAGAFRLRGALSRREWLVVVVPFALVALVYLTFFIATGHTSQNGMRTKSPLYAPDETWWKLLTPAYKFYRDMIFRHFPWLFDVSLRHLLDVFVTFGVLFGLGREARRGRPGVIWVLAAWFYGGLAIQSVVLPAAYHHGRYQMNYTFIYWLLAFWGAHVLMTLLPISRWQRQFMLGGLATLLVVMMGNTVVRFRTVYGQDCRTIHNQHVAMGEYIAEHLPADAAVAINDAGAISYYGGRYIYDLFGLTTNLAAQWKWLGEACIFEQVQHLEPDQRPRRPDHFAVYEQWYPRMAKSGFLTEIVRFEAPDPSIAGGKFKVLYHIDWDSMGDKTRSWTLSTDAAGEALRLVDQVDIAYRPDEMVHDYAYWRHDQESEWGSSLVSYGEYAEDFDEPAVADGGRHVREKEALTVTGLAAGQPLTIIRRTIGSAAEARLFVDEQDVGVWPASNVRGQRFREEHVVVPGDRIAASEVRLRIEVIDPDPREHSSKSAASLVGRSGRRQPNPSVLSGDAPEESQRAAKGKGKVKGKKVSLKTRKRKAKKGYRTYYYWFAQP